MRRAGDANGQWRPAMPRNKRSIKVRAAATGLRGKRRKRNALTSSTGGSMAAVVLGAAQQGVLYAVVRC
jgi:hypothetical protein